MRADWAVRPVVDHYRRKVLTLRIKIPSLPFTLSNDGEVRHAITAGRETGSREQAGASRDSAPALRALRYDGLTDGRLHRAARARRPAHAVHREHRRVPGSARAAR
ncbi:hypothetical protein GCM10009608_11070 [Pseudonocardia alaniniphila]